MTINPEGWPQPRGYSNGFAARGTFVAVAGQIGWDAHGTFASDDFVEQAAQALRNIVAVVRAAGGDADHVVRLTWYVVDRHEYLLATKRLGAVYREVFGDHFPAMTLVEVRALLEDRARVEIEATAIVPD